EHDRFLRQLSDPGFESRLGGELVPPALPGLENVGNAQDQEQSRQRRKTRGTPAGASRTPRRPRRQRLQDLGDGSPQTQRRREGEDGLELQVVRRPRRVVGEEEVSNEEKDRGREGERGFRTEVEGPQDREEAEALASASPLIAPDRVRAAQRRIR